MDNIYKLYDKQDWKDLPIRETPIMSERLLHMEQGIYDNSSRAAESHEKIESLKSYENLESKPKINGIELIGDASLDDLGITGYVDKRINDLVSSILEGES